MRRRTSRVRRRVLGEVGQLLGSIRPGKRLSQLLGKAPFPQGYGVGGLVIAIGGLGKAPFPHGYGVGGASLA